MNTHPYTAAMGAVHVALASLSLLEYEQAAFAGSVAMSPDARSSRPSRFGTEASRLGHPRLAMSEVKRWRESADESKALLAKYDALLDELRQRFPQTLPGSEDVKTIRNGEN
jgi:hypothetical protein